MPKLKQLTCTVEHSSSNEQFEEYQTAYSDGVVETYIAVPDTAVPFSVHLRSNGYIAPGLSMFVFMDGVYQCNRNRQNLIIPAFDTHKKQTEIDFRVRQKEESLEDGTFQGKAWKFEKVKIASNANVGADESAPYDGEYVGTIEVVVLRCLPADYDASSTSSTAYSSSSDRSYSGSMPENGQVDGATDVGLRPENQQRPEGFPFGLDGLWNDPIPEQGNKKEKDPWDWPSFSPVAEESNKDKPSSSKVDAIKEKFEFTSAKTGVHKPMTKVSATKKSASKAGSHAGSDRSRSRRGISEYVAHQPIDVQMRGGGPGSYSVSSYQGSKHGSGHRSPVIVNVYNGMGNASGVGGRAPSGQPAKAVDSWTANIDIPQATEGEPNTKEKVDAWNTGGAMPGGWGDSNDQKKNDNAWESPADQAQGNNDDWNTSGNEAQGADDSWNTGGNAADWDTPKDDAPANDTWDNNAGQASDWDQPKDDGAAKNGGGWNDTTAQTNDNGDDTWNNDVETKNADTGNGNWNNDTRQDDAWGGNNENEADKPDEDWNTGNGDNTQQNDAWENAPGDAFTSKPPAEKQGNKKGKGGASPKGSKTGSAEKPASAKSQAASNKSKADNKELKSVLKKKTDEPNNQSDPNKASEAQKSPKGGKKDSAPGAWSPTLGSSKKEKASQKAASKKGTPAASAAPKILSMSPPPKSQPYWSTWNLPSEPPPAPPPPPPPPPPAEGPLYTLPSTLVAQKRTSHQVRPGLAAAYTHKVRTPRYMDDYESPYAVFRFYYRSREAINEILGLALEDAEEARLKSLSKAELIEEILNSKDGGSRLSSAKISYKSNPKGQSQGVKGSKLQEQLSKLETSKAPTPEKVGGWLKSTNVSAKGSEKSSKSKKGTDSGEAWGAWGGNDNDNANADGTAAEEAKPDDTAWGETNNNWGDNNDYADDTNANDNDNDSNSNASDKKEDEPNDVWGATKFAGIDTAWGNKDETKGDEKGKGGKGKGKGQGKEQGKGKGKGKGKKDDDKGGDAGANDTSWGNDAGGGDTLWDKNAGGGDTSWGDNAAGGSAGGGW